MTHAIVVQIHRRAQIGILLAIQCVSGGIGCFCFAEEREATVSTQVLTSAAQVLGLSEAEASRALPVRLNGIVIGEAPPIGKAFVLWDSSEFIYVRWDAPGSCTFQQGDRVEVEGISGSGGFAPLLYMKSGRKLGVGDLPEPRELTAEQVIAGHFDAQWVRVRGIVRHCEPAQAWAGRWRLTLAFGGQLLTVHVNSEKSPDELVDAEVVVDGLFFNQHNTVRQFVRALLFVPSGVPIETRVAAPSDAFAAPVSPVASLLQFERRGRYGHRLHVRGTVLYHAPGGWIWLRDGDHGLRAASQQVDPLLPGDDVDILGFPAQGGYTPRLEDAVFRKNSAGKAPVALIPTDLRVAIAHDSDLIALEARLIDVRHTSDGITLLLDWQGALVPATLAQTENQYVSSSWIPGSQVRVAGLCTVSLSDPGPASGLLEPRSFALQMRTPDDLLVLQPPPWWNQRRMLWTLGLLAGALSLMVAIVMSAARRRLQEQKIRRAKAEAEFSAILAERNRMAREIHDTLAQGLAAISLQLELAKSDGDKDRAAIDLHLETAHRLVRENLADARASIWNMRSQVLESHDLAGALEGIMTQLANGTPVETSIHVAGDRRRLPPITENELLRIGQEAITNALRHATPRHLDVTLVFSEKQLELVVTDDGVGFDPDSVAQRSGSYGVIGIRERADQLGACLELTSAPGKGTRIALCVRTPD